jgi:chromosome segregation ATPase
MGIILVIHILIYVICWVSSQRQVTSLSVALQRSQTEVGSLKQRIDSAEQEASDSRSQITKVREVLEGERLKVGQDFRDREQNQQLWNDAGNNRQQQLSEGVFSLRQEMAVLKSDHEATRNR